MAQILHRLGALSAARKKTVLAGWAVVLAVLGVLAATSAGSFSTQFEIPGTESQEASELIAQRTPGARADAASGRVVFAAPAGERVTAREQRAGVERAVDAMGDAPGVVSASPPFAPGAVSDDGRVAYTTISFAVSDDELTPSALAPIERAAAQASDAGVQVALGGSAAAEEETHSSAEVVGVVLALVILVFTFGSLLAAGLPLLTGIFGVALGLIGVTAATAVFDLNDTAQSLVVMLGLAVGIDYALLIVSRHRSQVRDGMDVGASIARATATAGSAVVFAGATVVIALVALAVTGIPFLTQMGVAAAVTVALAVLINLTLVPALLALAGARAVRGKTFSHGAQGPDAKPTLGARWAQVVVRHRAIAVVVPVVGLLALAAPVLDMRLGLPNDGTQAPGTTQREAYDALAAGFGPGFNGPLTVVADLEGTRDRDAAASTVAAQLRGLDDVAAVSPPQANPAGDLAIVSVTPRSGPSSEETEDLVAAIRDRAPALRAATGAELRVTGETATNIDISSRVSGALVPYLAVVVGLAFVLLLLAFRSLLVPLTAIAGFLLTIGASFGAVTLVFQEGVLADLLGVAQTGPLLSFLPTLVIGVIFGLAMDYQVFLVSGMREAHAHGAAPQDAVRGGVRTGARVVTAAALIMIGVFAGFVIPDDAIIKSIGLAFAIGVLIDAFLVRMTLIPALMSFAGRRAWSLPSWLERRLPDVDIEGARLETQPG